MNPTDRPTAPAPADDQPVSDVARRVGPPLVVGSLVVMAALLGWLALAPTAIAGPLEDAPFTVPGTLVVPPDDDGCLRVVAGDGASREHCLEELAATDGDGEYRFTDAYFDAEGRLVVLDDYGSGRQLLHVDPESGQVLGTLDDTESSDQDDESRPAPGDEPPSDPPLEPSVYTDRDRVLRADHGEFDPDADPVVLDLQAPPGYVLHQAEVSPEQDWVVVVTGRDEVVVAPVDGSAAPHVWVELTDDRWPDLARAIQWGG